MGCEGGPAGDAVAVETEAAAAPTRAHVRGGLTKPVTALKNEENEDEREG